VGKSMMRRLLIAVMVLVALPVFLFVLAVVLVPRDRLAGQIATELETTTGAVVEPGTVTLKVAGGLGVRLSGGRIQGTGAELAHRTGVGREIGRYNLEYSRLEVSLDLGALVRRRLTTRKIEVVGPELVLEMDDGPIRVHDFSVRVTDLRLDLADLSAAVGPAPGDRIPADLAFGVQIGINGLSAGESTWASVQLAGQWAAQRLAVSELTARLGSGTITVTGSVDYGSDPWGVADWVLRLNTVPAGPLFSPYLPELAARLSCDLDGEVSGSLKLRDSALRRQTLAASGHLAAAEGVLQAADWLQEATPYLGARQDLKTVRFDRLEHVFRISEGRYLVDTLDLDGPDTDWQVQGWLGFSGDLGLRIGVRLPAGFRPDLGGMSFLAESLRDDAGRVRLGLKLDGRMVAPRFGLDLSSLGGGR